ncbi:hypothetical protein [Streptomyces fagopyri]
MPKPAKKRGVRIPWVTDSRGDRYGRSEIDRQPAPRYVTPLKCGGCGTRVSARHGHADDPDSRTSHYFRIDPHTAACRYDLDQRGKQLVDQAPGTVVRKAGQWRLICPPLHHGGTGGQKPVAGGPAHPARTGGAGPRVTSKQAGAAIASARRIVQILNDFDQDPDVAAEFAAVAPNGHRDIPWSEFCRGRADADQLAQALLDGTAAPIPHAVWGPVHHADAAGRNHDNYVVMYQAGNPVHIDGRPVPLRVAVRSNEPDWIGASTRSGKVLGYGYWQLFPADPAKARRQGWIELQLWIKQPWQATRWDTDGTTFTLPEPRATPKPTPTPAPAPERRTPPPAATAPLVPAQATAAEPAGTQSSQPDARAAEPEPILGLECDGPPERQENAAQQPTPASEPAPSDPAALAPPPRPPIAVPPLPPFPPRVPGASERRSRFARWLDSARRSRSS